MKQCQRPMVNQPCPIFKVSQQIAGTICPINIYKKKHQVYKYYSRELCPKDLCLCSELSRRHGYILSPNSIHSSFELCHQIHPFRKSTENSQVYLPTQLRYRPSSCEVTLFAINSLKRLNEAISRTSHF